MEFTAESTKHFLFNKSFYFPGTKPVFIAAKERSINKARDKFHNDAHSTHTWAKTGVRFPQLTRDHLRVARIVANYLFDI